MASQPLNTTITVQRRARAVRDNRRHTSIKHLTTPFDDFYVPAPGEEVQVVETRDSSFVTDAFRFGHPVVVAPRANCDLATVYAGVTGLDFPVRMIGNPRELQIQKTLANRADDLYGDLRDTCPSDAFEA
jgi:hypothetical protein